MLGSLKEKVLKQANIFIFCEFFYFLEYIWLLQVLPHKPPVKAKKHFFPNKIWDPYTSHDPPQNGVFKKKKWSIAH